jgi:hypothetical protein
VDPVRIQDPLLVSEAIVAWTGWRNHSYPAREAHLITDRLGLVAGAELLPTVLTLTDEFYESDARMTASDLVQMGNEASERFRQLHPELTDEAIEALTWCYTFDYK